MMLLITWLWLAQNISATHRVGRSDLPAPKIFAARWAAVGRSLYADVKRFRRPAGRSTKRGSETAPKKVSVRTVGDAKQQYQLAL